MDYTILSIDAWASSEGGWEWNDTYKIGKFPKELIDAGTRKILKWFRDNEFLSQVSKGKVTVIDDQNYLIIVNRLDDKPIFAIDYFSEN